MVIGHRADPSGSGPILRSPWHVVPDHGTGRVPADRMTASHQVGMHKVIEPCVFEASAGPREARTLDAAGPTPARTPGARAPRFSRQPLEPGGRR